MPAAFILLAPYGEAVERAWHGAAAIGLGAVIGALIGLVVFPEPAHRALERQLGEALGRCGDLLAAAATALSGDIDRTQIHAASDAIEEGLWAAGGMAAQSRYPSRARRRPTHPRPRELLRAVERLWHSLLLMERADRAALPEEPRREPGPAVEAFAATGSAYLRQLGEALTNDVPPPSPQATAERVQQLDEALRSLRRRGATRPLGSEQAGRVFTLAFAVQELSRNFEEVAGLFSGPCAPREHSSVGSPRSCG